MLSQKFLLVRSWGGLAIGWDKASRK